MRERQQTETVREMQQDVHSSQFANYQLWLNSQWCTVWVMERSLWIFCVSSLCSGSSLHADLRGPSIPSSPSCTPNTHTVLCSGNSEPNLNTTLNINLNSSLNSNYHAVFSSSTGLFVSLLSPMSIDSLVIILFSVCEIDSNAASSTQILGIRGGK